MDTPLELEWERPSAGFAKVFYYDALPCPIPNQTDGQFAAELSGVEKFHENLSRLDRFKVNQGHTRYGGKGRGREQKKVDVMIAVDMMVHTIRKNMEAASLLAGDGDFTPLLDAISNEGMFVTLIHPPRASKELLSAADARQEMTDRMIYDWLKPRSQQLLGAFPSPCFSDEQYNRNSILIWSGTGGPESGVSIWKDTASNTVWLARPNEGPNRFFCLRYGSWNNTRLMAVEGYGMELPDDLPQEFGDL